MSISALVIGLMLMPTHESVLPVFMTFSVIWTVSGHLGYDLQRQDGAGMPARILAGGAHHAWHHRYVHGNFGMYTRTWDRIMATDKGLLKPHTLASKR